MEHSAVVRGLQILDYDDVATCISTRGKWFHFCGQGQDVTFDMNVESYTPSFVTYYFPRSLWHIAEVPSVLDYYRRHMQPGKAFPLLELIERLGVTHRLRNTTILESAEFGHQDETDQNLANGFLTTWYRHRVEIPEPIRDAVTRWLASLGIPELA